MKRLIRLFLVVAVLIGTFSMPLSAAAGGDKVTLCHKPGTPDEVTIEVSVNALDAHLAHGDRVGTCTQVPVLTCPFEATAIPVIGSDIVKYTIDFPETPTGYAWSVFVSSSTEQDYRLYVQPSGGTPPPSPEYIWPTTGEVQSIGSPGYPSVWDQFVAKMYPDDTDFDHVVLCTAVLDPPLP